jgi:hypothetical protein
LFALSFNWSKSFIVSFWCNKKKWKSRMKKMKKHIFQRTHRFFLP